ncbi:MAG: hypothetical protein HY820_44720 [Acidobacteria bacterium]|nr:hypothetical protein [Acidobacteriota bacterium]
MSIEERNHDISGWRPSEISRALGISGDVLYRWRVSGRGPEWIKLGKVIVYPRASLQAWMMVKAYDTEVMLAQMDGQRGQRERKLRERRALYFRVWRARNINRSNRRAEGS